MKLYNNIRSLFKVPTTLPYLAIAIFVISIILKLIENAIHKSNSYYPQLVSWLIKNKLGFLVPIMHTIGINQFATANQTAENTTVIIVFMLFATIILMSITEIYYGHIGLILLFFISILTGPSLNTLKEYTCNWSMNGTGFCCGSIVLWIFAAAVINILFAKKNIYFGLIHIIILMSLVISDYYLMFKDFNNKYRLCISITHHSSIYVIGFISSLCLLSIKGPIFN